MSRMKQMIRTLRWRMRICWEAFHTNRETYEGNLKRQYRQARDGGYPNGHRDGYAKGYLDGHADYAGSRQRGEDWSH